MAIAAALVALALAASAGASGAARCWTPARTLVSSGRSISLDALATTAGGRAALLWGSYVDASSPAYDEGAGLLDPTSLAFASRSYLPLPGTASSDGVLAETPSGDLVAGWIDSFAQRSSTLVWSRLTARSTNWSAARSLPVRAGQDPSGLELRALPNGAVRAFWSSSAPGSSASDLYSSQLAGGAARWSRPRLLASAPSATPAPASVAVGPSGRLTVVWGTQGAWSWLVRTVGSSRWRSLRDSAKEATGVVLAGGADGTVVATWGDGGAWAAVLRPGAAAFTLPQQLTVLAPGETAPTPTVVVGDAGAATLVSSPASRPPAVFRLPAHGARFARAPASAAPRVQPSALVDLADGSVLAIGVSGTGTRLELAASRGVPGARDWGAPHAIAAVADLEISDLIATPSADRGALLGWVAFPPGRAITNATQRLDIAAFRTTGACSRAGLPPS